MSASVLAQIATLPNLEALFSGDDIDISWSEFALLKQLPKLQRIEIRDRKGITTVDQLVYLKDLISDKQGNFTLVIRLSNQLKETDEYKELEREFFERDCDLRAFFDRYR